MASFLLALIESERSISVYWSPHWSGILLTFYISVCIAFIAACYLVIKFSTFNASESMPASIYSYVNTRLTGLKTFLNCNYTTAHLKLITNAAENNAYIIYLVITCT